jgi:hypothetical protein
MTHLDETISRNLHRLDTIPVSTLLAEVSTTVHSYYYLQVDRANKFVEVRYLMLMCAGFELLLSREFLARLVDWKPTTETKVRTP